MKKLSFLLTALLSAAFFCLQSFAQTTVHVLDVGQGLSVLVESQGHYLLYDGGDSDRSSFVVSYLKKQGVSSLDRVIASHYDSDHLNGVVGALNVFPTAAVWGPSYTTDTKVFHSFLNVTAQKGLAVTQPAAGDSFRLGDAAVQVLAPQGSSYADENNYSIAIRIEDGETSFLITGDARSESESEMAALALPLESDVYVAGHHGSSTSSSWEFLQKVTPEYAIVSCGAGNSYGHPHAETMEKFQTMGISLFRTDKQGTIVASTDGKTLTWNTEPCNDYTPGSADDTVPQTQGTADSASGQNQAGSGAAGGSQTQQTQAAVTQANSAAGTDVSAETSYIVNTNTGKFHRPSCASVKKMKEKNKKAVTAARSALIAQGYSPCKNCNP